MNQNMAEQCRSVVNKFKTGLLDSNILQTLFTRQSLH